jgi:hypothetical protein
VSHIATVEVEFRDMDALAKACVKCGVELRQDQKTFRWYNDQVSSCDAAIVHPSKFAFEIGVHKTETGLRIEFDPHNRGKKYGPNTGPGMQDAVAFEDNFRGLGKLQQAYAVEVARKQAKRQGFSVREQVQADGRVKLTLSR